MTKFVELNKRSKREQRAFHALQRGNWGTVKPVSRVVPDQKKRRDKEKCRRRKWDE